MSRSKRARDKRTEALPIVTLPITALPFVAPSDQGRPHYWNVPAAGKDPRDHVEAEAIGRQYALQYAQWLQAYPELVGMGTLGWIAADIDFRDTERTGYWIGFFSSIERYLFCVELAR